jgi:hypothetical protein
VIDSILLSRATTFSDSLLETLGNIRAQGAQHVLAQICEQSQSRLFESMTEALLAFADELQRTPAQSWTESEMLLSSIDVLSPWVPCIRGLSFDHAPVMNTIAKHIGKSLFLCQLPLSNLQLIHSVQVHHSQKAEPSAPSSKPSPQSTPCCYNYGGPCLSNPRRTPSLHRRMRAMKQLVAGSRSV